MTKKSFHQAHRISGQETNYTTKYSEKPKYKSKISAHEVTNTVRVIGPVPQEAIARELTSFSVTTDSVVATLEIVYDDSHRFITIFWGDGDTGERIDLRSPLLQQTPAAGGPDLPENTLRLQYVYEVPEQPYTGSNLLVLVVVEDNEGRKTASTAQRIKVIPRYKFVLYQVIVEFSSHLDTGFESEIEFEADMTATHNGETILERNWKADLETGPSLTGGFPPGTSIPGLPVTYRLEGSQLSHEIALNEEPLLIHFVVKEHDGFLKDVLGGIWDLVAPPWVEFDTSGENFEPGFHPSYYTGSKTFRDDYTLDDGSVTMVFDTEMNLIVPLDRPNTLKAKQ
jgi:hypothetical protein